MIDLDKLVFLDFECYSELDIECGAYNYAQHPSTEILSLVYNFSGSDIYKVWSPLVPKLYDPCPQDLKWAIANGYTFIAHNAFFDWCIWNEKGHRLLDFPYLPIEQIADTMALCGAYALPASLENATQALGLRTQKDMEGSDLMKLMSKPRKPTKKDPRKRLWDIDLRQRLLDYNIIDVKAMKELWYSLDYLSEIEHEIFQLTMRMNYVGVQADLDTVRSIIVLSEKLKTKYTQELQEITNGEIQTGGQVAKIKEYLKTHFNLTVEKLDKFAIEKLLHDKSLHPTAKRIIELRQVLGRSSFAKFQKLLDTATYNEGDSIGIIRETMLYHHASTGRWGSKRLQLHNLIKYNYIRKYEDRSKDNPEWRLELNADLFKTENLDLYELYYGNASKPLSGFVRSCLIAADSNYYCGDFSGIEARGVFWISGQTDALDEYENGVDKYIKFAAELFGKPESEVSKKERNDFGKPGILGSGFGMGGPKLASKLKEETDLDVEAIGKEYIKDRVQKNKFSLFDYCNLLCYEAFENKKRTDEYATYLNTLMQSNFESLNWTTDDWAIKDYDYARAFGIAMVTTYRTGHPKVPVFWNDIERSVKEALTYGKTVELRNLRIEPTNDFLYIYLPSGRRLAYYKAHLEATINKFGKETTEIVFHGVDQKTKQFERQHTYGGALTENIVQAFSRDILAEAMLRLVKQGYWCRFTVHDEVVATPRKPESQCSLEEFLELMSIRPSWALDMPIEVEGWKGKRYRK